MQDLIEKAKSIRLLILDIDGTLTTGALYYGSQGIEFKGFHVHDGLGIKWLQRIGVAVAVISAKTSDLVIQRLNDLKVDHVYLGQENKRPAFDELKEKLQLKDHEIAYMGDDLPDLPLLKRAGFAITVPGAPAFLHQHCHWITTKKPGKGAVREACEFIMEAQGLLQSVLESYLV